MDDRLPSQKLRCEAGPALKPQDISSSDKAFGKTIINQARVRSSIHDWNPANNTASAIFVVGGLDIEKGVSTSSAAVGEIFTSMIYF